MSMHESIQEAISGDSQPAQPGFHMGHIQPWLDRKEKWVMPDWMYGYINVVAAGELEVKTIDAGPRWRIEGAVNATTNPMLNAPVAMAEANVKAQVYLLERLHAAGLLK